MIVRTLLATFLAWLVPGLGHAVQGRSGKAVFFAAIILGLFVLGVVLGEGASVSAERYPYHVYGQAGAALPAWLASLLGADPTGRTIDRLELGVVFTTVAGIMNVVAMVDVYEFGRTRLDAS